MSVQLANHVFQQAESLVASFREAVRVDGLLHHHRAGEFPRPGVSRADGLLLHHHHRVVTSPTEVLPHHLSSVTSRGPLQVATQLALHSTTAVSAPSATLAPTLSRQSLAALTVATPLDFSVSTFIESHAFDSSNRPHRRNPPKLLHSQPPRRVLLPERPVLRHPDPERPGQHRPPVLFHPLSGSSSIVPFDRNAPVRRWFSKWSC